MPDSVPVSFRSGVGTRSSTSGLGDGDELIDRTARGGHTLQVDASNAP